MATQRRIESISTENVQPGRKGKAGVGVGLSKGIMRRPALGEINKNTISNKERITKPALTKPTLLKKTTKTTTITLKETKKVIANTNTTSEITQKVNIIREESIVKHSILLAKEDTKLEDTKSYSSQRLEVLEEPEEQNSDPQLVSEYINDIFSYLRCLETKFTIDEMFLAGHRTTPRMRTVLVNWLVDVHMNFRMLQETLFLCISIIDRYLQKNKTVGRDNLQLVGITALLVAGKYEEMYIPDISHFVYVCDNTFTRDQVLRMELSIIKSLNYSFGRPLSLHFLRRFSKVAKVQPQHHYMSKYFLELALLDPTLCYIRPSLQAAAACCLSLSVLNEQENPRVVWSKVLIYHSRYTYAEIEKTVKLLANIVSKAETSKYQAIRKKFATSANDKISLTVELKGPVIKKLTQTQ